MPTFQIRYDDKIEGPYELSQIEALWRKGKIPENARYCDEDLVEWHPIQDLTKQFVEPVKKFPESVIPTFDVEVDPHLRSSRSRSIFLGLAIVLGFFGVHNFYAGRIMTGLIQLFVTLFFPFLGLFVCWPWAVFEGFTVSTDISGKRMK